MVQIEHYYTRLANLLIFPLNLHHGSGLYDAKLQKKKAKTKHRSDPTTRFFDICNFQTLKEERLGLPVSTFLKYQDKLGFYNGQTFFSSKLAIAASPLNTPL